MQMYDYMLTSEFTCKPGAHTNTHYMMGTSVKSRLIHDFCMKGRSELSVLEGLGRPA